ncbi:MAG TPA: sialidase family protein [Gemmatimonadaceae bacterium]|nr:sialidase family protein [Gemmatimonadaceae bacterium]
MSPSISLRRETISRFAAALTLFLATAALAACGADRIADVSPPRDAAAQPMAAVGSGPSGVNVVNVSNDTTAQNETPLAVNPLNAANMITGNNDWNWNDGCGVNATFDGGRSWTKTLPNGFLPGVTKYTDDPSVAGTGFYDYGGDPAVAFGPDGTAYFACFGYQAAPPYAVALLVSRSTDGGRTWLAGGASQPLVQAATWQGNGITRGSTGQFPDHESMHVANDGTIYIPWAQFNGSSAHSPIYVTTSRDGGRTFSPALKVTSGSIRNDQDARIVTDPTDGTAYLTFDTGIQGGKGTAMYVAVSHDHGASWSAPALIGTFQNPVCLYPPYCFNISGNAFRGPGSYPVPAFDPTRHRLYVAYTDIVNGLAQVLLTSASASDPTAWTPAQVVAPGAGDRINVEMSIEPGSGRIDMMTNDRSWSGNTLFDVTYLASGDGGASWSTRRVTQKSWDPSQYGVPSSSSSTGIRPFIGDYDGIVSLPTSAGMTWTGPGRTYGTYPTNLEVYFGSVQVP